MDITRRELVRSLGIAGIATGQQGFVSAALSQALLGIRPAFSDTFRLASSPLISATGMDGVRLRWNFPLFKPDGEFDRCLPDRVIVHRKIVPLNELYVPKDPSVGLPPIAVYPDFAWRLKRLVQVSSGPARFSIVKPDGSLSSAEAIEFTYHGPAAKLKISSSTGTCLLIAPLKDGDQVYFDASAITDFEVDTFGPTSPRITGARCLDVSSGGELNLNNPLAELAIRRPFADRFALTEGARRFHGRALVGGPNTTLPPGQPFLDENEWRSLLELASEISAETCTGKPALESLEGGIQVSRIDLFMLALLSRWEMAPRLGFGFRDGPDPTSSRYDVMRGNPIDTNNVASAAQYQVEAIWDTGKISARSNTSATRLDRYYPLSKPRLIGYYSGTQGQEKSDYIAVTSQTVASPDHNESIDIVVGDSTLRWDHGPRDRVSGVFIQETIEHLGGATQGQADWLHHRGVYGNGFHGNVRRPVPVTFGAKVRAVATTFDQWDVLSADGVRLEPEVVLQYNPAAPKLACATFRAGPADVTGNIRIERLVTTPAFRPSCLMDANAAEKSEYAEWKPDALFTQLGAAGFKFRLQVLEARRTAKQAEAKITEYGNDSSGNFVRFDRPIPLADFLNGSLEAQNGRYFVRNFLQDRLYIGRFKDDLSSGVDQDGTCQIAAQAFNVNEIDEPQLGSCTLSENFEVDALWREVFQVEDISSGVIPLTFDFASDVPRPDDFPEMKAYRCRILGKRNAEVVTGEFSNIAYAQRTPIQPPEPKPFSVRQLGYDYYDRLLVAIELSPAEPMPGVFAVSIAPGAVRDATEFGRTSMRATLIGEQSVSDRLIFESLTIDKNFQTDRKFSVGVARLNRSGTAGPAKIQVINVPVE